MKVMLIIIMALVLAGTGTVMGQNIVNDRSVSELVNIRIIIPSISKIMLLGCADKIVVTDRDIMRGYVEMPNAISFKVWANSQGGSIIETQLAEELQSENGDVLPVGDLSYRIKEDEPYTPFDINGQKLCFFTEAISGKLVTMDIRLNLAKGSKPGTYQYLPCFNLASL